MLNAEENLREKKKLFEDFLKGYCDSWLASPNPSIQRLSESIRYSLLSGGKRFRPTLSLVVAEALSESQISVLPFAVAVEMIHTYSLIHDDLPSMDNDVHRRGKPTNHIAYDEATALLAGDALLTESFNVLASSYKTKLFLAIELIELLSKSAGASGMVGGQAIDLNAKGNLSANELEYLHNLKTGALISCSIEGTALICGADSDTYLKLKEFGKLMGLAFQIKDDLLDAHENKEKHKSYVGVLGIPYTKELLEKTSQSALNIIHGLKINSTVLEFLINENQERQK